MPSILIDGVLVYLIYSFLKSQTSVSDLVALLISSVPILLNEIVSISRHRQLDVFGCMILVLLAITAVASFIGGDPKLLLVRESFSTLALAVACIVSLPFPRPLMFYIIRFFATGNDPARAPAFNARWQYPAFRRYMRIVTVAWGIVYLIEFPVRIFMVYHMPIQQYLAISPIAFYAILFVLIGFTITYARRMMSRFAEQNNQREDASMETTGIQA